MELRTALVVFTSVIDPNPLFTSDLINLFVSVVNMANPSVMIVDLGRQCLVSAAAAI